jgi:lipid-A-disaccharide synthase
VEGILDGRTAIKSRIQVVEGEAMISARAALMSSGTMSLSCAVSSIPGVIAYRAHPITYFLGRILVKIPYLGMANILLPDDPPYPEFIQWQANGKQLAEAMSSILLDKKAEAKSALVSEKLLKCLTCSTERGAAKWLIQVASLC